MLTTACTIALPIDAPAPSMGAARLQMAEDQGAAPFTVQLEAETPAGVSAGAVSYSWDFGDGATATGKSVEHTYTRAGTFTVGLEVTSGGVHRSTSAQVSVLPGSLASLELSSGAAALYTGDRMELSLRGYDA
ncbi:MAG: PKD domain-containing protein, partial [Dehalococcoidia bacterium]